VQIDWLTVAAQIVNFLVLVWLLQRFLYRPITRAMERREAAIVARRDAAEDARAQAEAEAEALRQDRAALDAAKAEIMESARAEAEALRQRLEQDLRAEMADKRAVWQHHLDSERADFLRSVQRQAGAQLLEIAARVLADFADADLSGQVAARFAARLDALDEETREKLHDAARAAEGAVVESGVALDPAAKARVTRALHAALATDLAVAYRETPDLVLGFRLIVGEQSLEWSAARYLRRLEAELGEILDAESHAAKEGHAR